MAVVDLALVSGEPERCLCLGHVGKQYLLIVPGCRCLRPFLASAPTTWQKGDDRNLNWTFRFFFFVWSCVK